MPETIAQRTQKLLLAVNTSLRVRVIDAENIGFSYGSDVNGDGHWSKESVVKAFKYFIDEKIIKVRVVTKRASLRNSFLQEEMKVDIAETTDDVMIINVSYNINVQL